MWSHRLRPEEPHVHVPLRGSSQGALLAGTLDTKGSCPLLSTGFQAQSDLVECQWASHISPSILWKPSLDGLCSPSKRCPFHTLDLSGMSCLPWDLTLSANYMADSVVGECGAWGQPTRQTT